MPDARITEEGITAPAQDDVTKTPERRRYAQVSRAELYAALEGLLEPAQIEIDWLATYVKDFPDDEDHAQDAERVRRGQAAIALAKRLIARKTYAISLKQRAFSEKLGHGDACHGSVSADAELGAGARTGEPSMRSRKMPTLTDEEWKLRGRRISEGLRAYWRNKRGEATQAGPEAESDHETNQEKRI